MTINKTEENGAVILALEGRLDTTTAPELEAVLLPVLDDCGELNMDFEKLDYLSSAGLRVLLAGQKKANKLRKTLVLQNVNETIMEVFEMTGFADILTIE
ncbi:MAG: STAS domain-containing protein [Blautia sp.]|jgi:anti-anti-sigma factor